MDTRNLLLNTGDHAYFDDPAGPAKRREMTEEQRRQYIRMHFVPHVHATLGGESLTLVSRQMLKALGRHDAVRRGDAAAILDPQRTPDTPPPTLDEIMDWLEQWPSLRMDAFINRALDEKQRFPVFKAMGDFEAEAATLRHLSEVTHWQGLLGAA